MKTLEVRRHSLTKKGTARAHGSLLSADGVHMARSAGESLSGFDYVLTGPDHRHVETAIAMGYAVDETVDWSSGYVSGVVGHHDQWHWELPYVHYSELLHTSPALRDMAEEHLGPLATLIRLGLHPCRRHPSIPDTRGDERIGEPNTPVSGITAVCTPPPSHQPQSTHALWNMPTGYGMLPPPGMGAFHNGWEHSTTGVCIGPV